LPNHGLLNLDLGTRPGIVAWKMSHPSQSRHHGAKIRPTGHEVAVVDELAHTNITGSRNHKRWQDIDELLDAGIDVRCPQ
jgi:hypothetical protein